MSRTFLTESKRIQKLLSLEPLGDQKPSQLLQQIEQLADKTGNDNPILQEIFLTRLPVAVQLVLKSDPTKVQSNSLPLLTASLQSPQKPLYLGPSAPSHLSLLILILLPLSALSWKTLNINSPCNRKLANFHLPLPPLLPSHSVGTMPDLANMPPNAKKPCSMSGNAFPAHLGRPVGREITVAFSLLLIALLANATWSILVPKSACFLQHVLTVRHSRSDSLSEKHLTGEFLMDSVKNNESKETAVE